MADDMYTRCPGCATVFRVTDEQLAKREGQVRCGHCKAVFDGRASRVELGAAAPIASVAATTTPADVVAQQPSAPRSAPERSVCDVLQPSADEPPLEAPLAETLHPDGPAPEAPPPAEGAPQASLDEQDATQTSLDEHGAPQTSLDEQGAPQTSLDEQGAPQASLTEQPAPQIAAPPEPAPIATAAGEAPGAPLDGAGSDVAYEDRFAPVARRPSRRARIAWYASATIFLLLLLALQALLHFHDAIAAHWPPARPALDRLCSVTGCAIRPLRDSLMSYLSIESSDLQADPAHRGLLILTAAVRNRAPWPLAYPYLELTLTDAQDRVVVRRALAPADYVGGTADINAGIGANAEIALKVFIDASATTQAGYRLYMFYP